MFNRKQGRPEISPAGSCHWAEFVPRTGNTTEHHADRVELSRESLCDLIPLPAEWSTPDCRRVGIEHRVRRICESPARIGNLIVDNWSAGIQRPEFRQLIAPRSTR